MAAARKLKLSVTSTAQTFGDAVKQDYIFQNHANSANDVFIDCQGYTAVADIGFVLAPGKDVSNKDLPEFMRQGPYSIISAGTADVHVQFAKPRGE